MPDGARGEREETKLSSELERRVEHTDALVQSTIGRLSRSYPEHVIGTAASEGLRQIRPHLEEALRALAQIEEDRKLTDKELCYRRAFEMLSRGSLTPRGKPPTE